MNKYNNEPLDCVLEGKVFVAPSRTRRSRSGHEPKTSSLDVLCTALATLLIALFLCTSKHFSLTMVLAGLSVAVLAAGVIKLKSKYCVA